MSDKILNTINDIIIKKCKRDDIEPEWIIIWKYIYNQCIPHLTTFKSLTFNPIKSNIILTMTTCKRLHLFTQTINSMLNTWIDLPLIDYFFIVDDNSDISDREEMTNTYPFIDFYMKNEQEKGHMNSMNIIYHKLKELDVKYWIHVEDDFLFFYSTTYITTGINGLNKLSSFNGKQIMFNRNYAETIDQINLIGHIPYADDTYALHNYITTSGTACQYWPNFSFRPSIIDVQTILSLGDFTMDIIFFEREYADRYSKAGYRTAFFNFITNQHIGKLTFEIGVNAYMLNKVPQFNEDFKIKVINLKRRPDRLDRIKNNLYLKYNVVSAVDGQSIAYNQEIEKIFRGNDFHSKKTVIACALSHYYIWQELVQSNCPLYIIIEDDATFCDDFKQKVLNLIYDLYERDIVFMGYLIFDTFLDNTKNKYYIKNNHTTINDLEKKLYMGGTHCYSITKTAAVKLLKYIDENGIKHGIDYLMAKVQNVCNVFETVPHLAYIDNPKDSDIQYNTDFFKELEVNIDDYIFMEGLDQMNYDISKESDTSIHHLAKKTKELNGVAFNTFGYIKSKVEVLEKSTYFSNNDGIYVDKNYYLKTFKKK
jgi:GR25 family glycosyltransferase involved in LPS biosynthesis